MSDIILVIVDTDDGFVKRFRKKLAEEGLDTLYILEPVVPDTTLLPSDMVNSCLREIETKCLGYATIAVFIDIMIVERGEFDTSGLDLARNLKRQHPEYFVFPITAKLTHPEGYDIQYDAFSGATLEGYEGVFEKGYLDGKGFSAKRLKEILAKANQQSLRSTSGRISQTSTEKSSITSLTRTSHLEVVGSYTELLIIDFKKDRFFALIEDVLPFTQGTIVAISPGRSGAAVFKIFAKFTEPGKSPTAPKTWLLKVSEQGEDIQKEANNHTEVRKSPIPHSSIPNLFHLEPKEFQGLFAIAYEFECDAMSLLNHTATLSTPARVTECYSTLMNVLFKTYGDPVYKIVSVWKNCFAIQENAKVKILAFLESENKLLQAKVPVSFLKVKEFLDSDGQALLDDGVNIDTRTIHGDLNCGNILVYANQTPVLIDFALRKQAHIALDAAKLERDLIFRVLDSGDEDFYSWVRFERWCSFRNLNTIESIFSPDCTHFNQDDIVSLKIVAGILEIRKALHTESSKTSSVQYAMALLHYSLLAIVLPDISINKRVFAVEYAADFIGKLSK